MSEAPFLLATADLLILTGLLVLTLMVRILWHERSLLVAIHGASGAATAVAIILAAGLFAGDAVFAVRSLVVAFFLLVTAPVSAQVIARTNQTLRHREDRETDE